MKQKNQGFTPHSKFFSYLCFRTFATRPYMALGNGKTFINQKQHENNLPNNSLHDSGNYRTYLPLHGGGSVVITWYHKCLFSYNRQIQNFR